MSDLRQQIYELGRTMEFPVWVSEHSDPSLSGLPLNQVQMICLRMVREHSHFVCVLDGTYGTPWDVTQLSILELELFTAVAARKRISIFLQEPFEPDPRLLSFLKLVEGACPEALDRKPMSKSSILMSIRVLIEEAQARRGQNAQGKAGLVGLILKLLARWRSPALAPDFNYRDLQFLGGEYAPLARSRPDRDLLQVLIDQASGEPNAPIRLGKLWAVMRHLSAVPYVDPGCSEYLPFWERTLGLWASSAAWYGLHGHFLIGRLAAVNSLLQIRERMSEKMRDAAGTPSIQGTLGAVASEYYSIAKLVPSWRDHRILLEKALWSVGRALEMRRPSDRSGLLAIRGSVLLALGRPWKGVHDFEEVLRMRLVAGEDLGRVGEAESELGFGYFRIGRWIRAQELLEAGVAHLLRSDRYPFTVRALRKLAFYYRATLRFGRAENAIEQARILAEKYELEGQRRQLSGPPSSPPPED